MAAVDWLLPRVDERTESWLDKQSQKMATIDDSNMEST
jgi:hypothetical protein